MMKSLWAQKKYLEVIDGVVYQRWEMRWRDSNKCFQLIIPPSLVPTVLAELHDSPMAGHLGVGKVLEMVRRRFYWVGQRNPVVKPLTSMQPSTRMILMGTKISRFEEHMHIGIITKLLKVNSCWPLENLHDMVCAQQYYT